MDDYSIRKATINDKDAIYHNIELCANDMFEKQGLNHWIPVYSIEKIEKDIIEKEVFVLEYQNNIIGNFTMYSGLNELWKDNYFYNNSKRIIYVSKLCIIPEYSKHGLGKMCMKYIENYSKNNQYDCVCLDVYDKAIYAVNFYKKNGYSVLGEAKTRRFNVLLMKKDIDNE